MAPICSLRGAQACGSTAEHGVRKRRDGPRTRVHQAAEAIDIVRKRRRPWVWQPHRTPMSVVHRQASRDPVRLLPRDATAKYREVGIGPPSCLMDMWNRRHRKTDARISLRPSPRLCMSSGPCGRGSGTSLPPRPELCGRTAHFGEAGHAARNAWQCTVGRRETQPRGGRHSCAGPRIRAEIIHPRW